MKKCWLIILTTFLFLGYTRAQQTAADSSAIKHRIAVFAPIYLDSAFNSAGEYRYAKNEFPKFINEGVQMALDSLELEGIELEVFVYDTRSSKESLSQQLQNAVRDSVQLLLVNCTSQEVKTFAEFALKHKIPFINTTIPNDGGIQNNPYLVILNPTLRTQAEGIYRFLNL